MQNKKRLHKHLLIIYIIYFTALVAGFAADFIPHFSRGYEDARSTSSRDISTGRQRTYYVDAKLNGDTSNAITIEGLPENISARIERLQMQVTVDEQYTFGNAFRVIANDGYSYALIFVTMFSFLAVFVLIALIINSIRKSIRDEQPLRNSNILRTRWIGALIIGAELSEALCTYINYQEAARLLTGTSFEVTSAFPISYWNLIVGILFLFMAEVLSISAQLSEEQKLTI